MEALHLHINLLVQEADYPEVFQECEVHNNLIQCLKNVQVCDKIAQEGNGITLTRVSEIACLEASTKLQMQMLHDKLGKQVDSLQHGPKFQKGGQAKGYKKDTTNST